MIKKIFLIITCLIVIYLASAPLARASQVFVLADRENYSSAPARVTAASPTQAPITPLVQPDTSQPRFIQRFLLDPLANSIAVIVLLAMIASIIALAYRFINPPDESNGKSRGVESAPGWRRWIVPILSVLGLGVAGYMTYIEFSHTQALCGPIGNCNSVQTSRYATLWGFMPVGVFGMIGYIAIAIAWVVQSLGTDNFKHYLSLVMWGMALLGVLFSIYLTFLEPFVIGATCAWCISSAIIITLLLWTTTGPAIQASSELSSDEE
jgi:uncharacterized membrane protein